MKKELTSIKINGGFFKEVKNFDFFKEEKKE
jgi:hypothetical protein